MGFEGCTSLGDVMWGLRAVPVLAMECGFEGCTSLGDVTWGLRAVPVLAMKCGV